MNPAGQFVVGIGPLASDPQGLVRRFIVEELAALDDEIQVREVRAAALSLDTNVLDSLELAQRLRPTLIDAQVDVLIGGRVTHVDGEPVPLLHVVSAPRDWQAPNPLNGNSGRPLRIELYELPAERWADNASLLQLIVLAEAVRFDPRHYPPSSTNALLQAVEEQTSAKASGAFASWSPTSRWRARCAYASALRLIGLHERSNDSLYKSIEVWRSSLEDAPRATQPLRWAETQHSLALALQTLAPRGSIKSKRFEEAIATLRAALEVRKRESAPLEWATTQDLLGDALRELAGRESTSSQHLEQAVSAFRSALEERTRERAPLDWAATQRGLGVALAMLGERNADLAQLQEAVAALRLALEELTLENCPMDWAKTQSLLGLALASLGAREEGSASLQAAVVAFRAALEVESRERVPWLWAATQHELGAVLGVLGTREQSAPGLEGSVAALRAALEVRAKEDVPFDWVETQQVLGTVLRTLAALRGRVACDAIAAHFAAFQSTFNTPARRSKALAELELDLKGTPSPTPELCRSVPSSAWSRPPR